MEQHWILHCWRMQSFLRMFKTPWLKGSKWFHSSSSAFFSSLSSSCLSQSVNLSHNCFSRKVMTARQAEGAHRSWDSTTLLSTLTFCCLNFNYKFKWPFLAWPDHVILPKHCWLQKSYEMKVNIIFTTAVRTSELQKHSQSFSSRRDMGKKVVCIMWWNTWSF